MEDFSETVTFRELVERMEAGENFYDILGSTESTQREICFRQLVELTGKEYNHFYYLYQNNSVIKKNVPISHQEGDCGDVVS